MFIKSMLILLALVGLPLPIIAENPVIAEVSAPCVVFDSRHLSNATGRLLIGSHVEILEDYSAQIYKIVEPFTQTTGWVDGCYLIFPPDTSADKSILSPMQLEDFVDFQDYTSDTDYLVLTDIGRQKLHVLTRQNDAWIHIKSFDCSTGLNISPTTRGIFTITDRGPWFYSERLSSGAKFWMRFNGQYLIHSIPMDRHMRLIPGEDIVGEKRSSGCIRLMPQDAKWIYENIPDGTAVVIL